MITLPEATRTEFEQWYNENYKVTLTDVLRHPDCNYLKYLHFDFQSGVYKGFLRSVGFEIMPESPWEASLWKVTIVGKVPHYRRIGEEIKADGPEALEIAALNQAFVLRELHLSKEAARDYWSTCSDIEYHD